MSLLRAFQRVLALMMPYKMYICRVLKTNPDHARARSIHTFQRVLALITPSLRCAASSSLKASLQVVGKIEGWSLFI